MDLEIKVNDDVVFCNCKWEEANGLYSDAWGCYMELGKHLRELKEGKLKGQFTEWCAQELEFSYDWANILIKAYKRYELSEFTDPPQINIQLYAEPQKLLESTPNDSPQTEENTVKEKKTKEPTKIEIWCEEQGLDDLQTDVVKAWYNLSKRVVKKYGVQAIGEAIELINDSPNLYKQI